MGKEEVIKVYWEEERGNATIEFTDAFAELTFTAQMDTRQAVLDTLENMGLEEKFEEWREKDE